MKTPGDFILFYFWVKTKKGIGEDPWHGGVWLTRTGTVRPIPRSRFAVRRWRARTVRERVDKLAGEGRAETGLRNKIREFDRDKRTASRC